MQKKYTRWAIYSFICAAAIVGLYFVSEYNYLLFHALVELFGIIISAGVFIIAWNSGSSRERTPFLLLGIGHLSIAI